MSQTVLFDEDHPREARVSWFGQGIVKRTSTLAELMAIIPSFDRLPFSTDDGVNAYLDQIVREPIGNDGRRIPVATVSKQYVLIQHQDILTSFEEGLRKIGFPAESLTAELTLSEYGERMLFALTLPDFGFDPGDGCPIVLNANCINSVDKSCALEIKLSWHRLVCGNGMMFGVGSSNLRRVHLKSLDADDIAEYLSKQLNQVSKEQSVYKEWLQTPVKLGDIERWVDGPLSEEWGAHLAARAFHIIRTGCDGEIENPFESVKPHERHVTGSRKVPGIDPPVVDAFHVSQVLSWLAKERGTVQDQLDKVIGISPLIGALLNP
jgi:hypothetical protein